MQPSKAKETMFSLLLFLLFIEQSDKRKALWIKGNDSKSKREGEEDKGERCLYCQGAKSSGTANIKIELGSVTEYI